MKRLLPVLMGFVVLILGIAPANAQSSKASNAIQCATLSQIMSLGAADKKQAKTYFKALQRMFEGIWVFSEEKRLQRKITIAMVSKKKSQIQLDLKSKLLLVGQTLPYFLLKQ